VDPVDSLVDPGERLWTVVHGQSFAGPLALTFEGTLVISTEWPDAPACAGLFLFACGSRLVGLDERHNHVELTYQRSGWSAPRWWGPDEFGEWERITTLGQLGHEVW